MFCASCGKPLIKDLKMVEEQLKTDINLLQSQTNSSENIQNESAGASNIASSLSNVELPPFQDYRSRSNLDV